VEAYRVVRWDPCFTWPIISLRYPCFAWPIISSNYPCSACPIISLRYPCFACTIISSNYPCFACPIISLRVPYFDALVTCVVQACLPAPCLPYLEIKLQQVGLHNRLDTARFKIWLANVPSLFRAYNNMQSYYRRSRCPQLRTLCSCVAADNGIKIVLRWVSSNKIICLIVFFFYLLLSWDSSVGLWSNF
jgi:hypothetical protein